MALRVLFVGRLAPERDIGLWLNVARRCIRADTTVAFRIVGDGVDAALVRAALDDPAFSGRLDWRGALVPEQVAAHYRSADVLLHTSRFEGFGRVFVEAGRAGLPVVATNTTGARAVIRDGETGFVRPHNPAVLAECLDQLAADADLRRRLGDAAERHVPAAFDPDRLAKGYTDFLLTVARMGRAG